MEPVEKRQKHRIKLKLFLCYQPVSKKDSSLKPHRTAINSVRGKECMVIPNILTPLSQDKSTVSAGDVLRPKEGLCRRFSLLKAVFFEAKKIRKRKAGIAELSAKNKKIVTSVDESNLNGESSTNSTIGGTSFSSSCTSSSTSNSCSSSETERNGSFGANSIQSKQVHEQMIPINKVGGHFYSDIGLCLLLSISLWALIFWGRICAIFCTTTSFFCAPCLNNCFYSPKNEVDWPQIDSEEHKERVIMEGALERNRYPSFGRRTWSLGQGKI